MSDVKPGVFPELSKTIKLRGSRKLISEAMHKSVVEFPQGTLWNKINMGNLLSYKSKLKADNNNVSVTSFLVKAASLALADFPVLNSALLEKSLHIYKSINIGVTVDSKDGLYIVVIKETQNKNVFEIAAELKKLVADLNNRTINMEDLQGGTFTISNLGMFDLDGFTPMLFPPQTAILGVGATRKEAVVDENDNVAIAQRAEFTLTINHAATDGVPGAKFIEKLNTIIGNPEKFLNEKQEEV